MNMPKKHEKCPIHVLDVDFLQKIGYYAIGNILVLHFISAKQ